MTVMTTENANSEHAHNWKFDGRGRVTGDVLEDGMICACGALAWYNRMSRRVTHHDACKEVR